MMMNSSRRAALKLLRTAAATSNQQQRCISRIVHRGRRRPLLKESSQASTDAETWGLLTTAAAVMVALSASSALSSSLEQPPQYLEKRSSPAKRGLVAPAVCFHKDDSDKVELPHSPGPLQMHQKYDIDFTKCLGQGAYSKVFRVQDKKTGEALALKRIARVAYDSEAFARETGALLQIQQLGGHEGIMGLKDMYSDDHYYFLVLPVAEGGELYDDLVDNGSYDEADAARLMQTIAGALSFLHNKVGLCHADLKPENLLLQKKDRSEANITLIDFGCATSVEDGATKTTASGGTSAYYSPERFEDDRATPAADMWSIGVLLYIMLADVHPFDRQGIATDEEIQHAIRQCKSVPLPEHLSPGARDVLSRLLEVDPRRRMTAQDLMEHSWVKQQQNPAITSHTSEILESAVTSSMLS